MRRERPNPKRDSWKPGDKAAEARIDNPAEFREPRPLVETAKGPVPTRTRKSTSEG